MFKTNLRTTRFIIALTAVQSLCCVNAVSACAPPAYRYVTVTVWETRQAPQTIWVTAYDADGCAYRVPKTIYNTIRVPVTQTVKVRY